jgi:hypothetical protein
LAKNAFKMNLFCWVKSLVFDPKHNGFLPFENLLCYFGFPITMGFSSIYISFAQAAAAYAQAAAAYARAAHVRCV